MAQSSTAGASRGLGIGAVAIAGGGMVALYTKFKNDPQFLMILAGGAVAVGFLLILFRLLLRFRAKRKARQMGAELTSGSRRPRELADPKDLARISELTQKFQQGIKIFSDAGKDLYSLPWYVLVGEPGSGKTEALRHCGVPAPAGLGELPGIGGTINMNWWFTNQGVVIDTAGRIMFQQVEPGQVSEWKQFLELLNKTRPNCPVNGLLLVIPADSLIVDTADKIQEKAGRIARQLDLIQRTLGVRFPVFVVVTKSDLINGFRSFFDTLNDPQLAHQILGWSNPSKDLDAPFDPEHVDKHLQTVRDRLLNRRMALLMDPVNTEDPSAGRIDQVDDLYAYPDSLVSIAPRLRRYLEMIFVQGEWSPKPLFLRGIYFTSSMRQGASLDKELADALGVPVDSLPEGRTWDQERAFFLRDLFLKKVFPEKGLVTREKRATGLHRRRKILVLTAGFSAAALLLGFTIYGAKLLQDAIVVHRDWWSRLSERTNSGNNAATGKDSWNLIQVSDTPGDAQFAYAGSSLLFGNRPADPVENPTLRDLHAGAVGKVGANISVPFIFRPMTIFQGDLAAKERRDAYRNVFEKSVLIPLINAVHQKLTSPTSPPWDDATADDATAVLTQLCRLETSYAGGPLPDGKHLELDPLFRCALGGPKDPQYLQYQKDQQVPKDQKNLQDTFDWLYSPAQNGVWPPSNLVALVPPSQLTQDVNVGSQSLIAYWKHKFEGDLSERPSDLTSLRQAFFKLQDAENKLNDATLVAAPDGVKDVEQYKIAYKAWKDGLAEIAADAAAIDPLAAKVRARAAGKSMLDMYSSELSIDLGRGQRAFQTVLTQLPAMTSAGAKSSQDAFDAVSKARATLITSQKELPPSDQPPILQKIQDQFNAFNQSYLVKDASGVLQPAFQNYVKAYDEADKGLPDPTSGFSPLPTSEYLPGPDETVPDEVARLTGRLDKISADMQTNGDAVDRSLPPDVPHADQVRQVCRYVIGQMKAPCWRYLAINSVIEGPSSIRSEEDVARIVGLLTKASGASMADKPVLPFVQGLSGHQKYAENYQVDSAKALVMAWQGLGKRLHGTVATTAAAGPSTRPWLTDEVLDATHIQVAYQSTTAVAVAPYVDACINYWLGMISQASNPNVVNWATFQAGLRGLSTANENLIKLVNSVYASLQNLTPIVPAQRSKDVADAIANLRRAAPALSPPQELVQNLKFLNACNLALGKWSLLSRDPTEASRSVFTLGAVNFFRDYVIQPDTEPDVAFDYWRGVTLGAFDALCQACPIQPNPANNVRKTYDLFPLAPPLAGRKELDQAGVDKARLAVEAAVGQTANLAEEPTDKEKDIDPDLWKKFRHLGPIKPGKDDQDWLDRSANILKALPTGNNPTFCNISTETADKQKIDNASLGARAVSLGTVDLNFINVTGEVGHVEYPFPATEKDVMPLAKLALDDRSKLGFEFKTLADAPPMTSNVKESGPWACIRVLYDTAAVKYQTGKVWHVQVVQSVPQKVGAPKLVAAWVVLEFDDPIPIAK